MSAKITSRQLMAKGRRLGMSEQRTEVRAGRELEWDTVRLRVWDKPEGKNVTHFDMEGLRLGRV